MQSDATTVAQYVQSLSPERRAIIKPIRAMIRKHRPKGITEGMQYGMIGYFVPHSKYPAGYHCKPAEPLPFLSLASQKNHCALYAMSLYMNPETLKQFQADWKATGKKLDMGKSCIRFKKLEDFAMDVVADYLDTITVDDYIATYESSLNR
ncbi:MAG: DUF1801 domain-containing protein [Planctomycetota bacterium]